MTDVTLDLDGLERLLAAKVGTWEANGDTIQWHRGGTIFTSFRGNGKPHDAELVVAAVEALPALIALARRAVPGGGEVREAVHAWLREDATLAAQMTMTPSIVGKLVDRLSAIRSNAGE